MYSKALPLLHKICKRRATWVLKAPKPQQKKQRNCWWGSLWIVLLIMKTLEFKSAKQKAPVTTSCGFQVPHIACVLYTHKTHAKLKQYTHIKYKQNEKLLSLPVLDFKSLTYNTSNVFCIHTKTHANKTMFCIHTHTNTHTLQMQN